MTHPPTQVASIYLCLGAFHTIVHSLPGGDSLEAVSQLPRWPQYLMKGQMNGSVVFPGLPSGQKLSYSSL